MASVVAGPVAIIGLGVIGGSLAQALHRAGTPVRAFAAGANDRNAATLAGIDVALDLAHCVRDASIVLVAVPLAAHHRVCEDVMGSAPPTATLLHAGSLQAFDALAAAAGSSPRSGSEEHRRVIGTHPIAGSHGAGFAVSDPAIFVGCTVSVEDRASADERQVIEALWKAAGAAHVEYRTAEEHDHRMVWLSHLPQLASTAVAMSIAAQDLPASALGPGGRDVTRLAASPYETWRGIVAGARPAVIETLLSLEECVGALRSAIEANDMQAVEDQWARARAWRQAG